MLSNGKEHFILKGNIQRKLTHVKDKFVRHTLYVDNSFYFLCTKNYDRDIDILNSRLVDFNASIKRSIEPGLMEVLDMRIYKSIIQKDNSSHGVMKILIRMGEHLYHETVDLARGFHSKPFEAHIHSQVRKHYYGYGFNWPYFCYINECNKHPYIYVLNSFNPTFV